MKKLVLSAAFVAAMLMAGATVQAQDATKKEVKKEQCCKKDNKACDKKDAKACADKKACDKKEACKKDDKAKSCCTKDAKKK